MIPVEGLYSGNPEVLWWADVDAQISLDLPMEPLRVALQESVTHSSRAVRLM